jgi:hypothetical protein
VDEKLEVLRQPFAAEEEPVLLEPEHGRVGVPGGRQREAALELGAKIRAADRQRATPPTSVSAICSPTITAGTFVLARGMTGISEQSATTTPSSP